VWWNTRGAKTETSGAITALEERLERLERASKGLKLEWEDVFDRLNRMMGRLNARIRKNNALEGAESDGVDAPDASETPRTPHGTHAVLSAMRARRGGP